MSSAMSSSSGSPIDPKLLQIGGEKRERGDDDHRSGKKKRNRAALSCAECRRSKTKCDRQIPCSGCVKRGCAEICPNGSSGTLKDLLVDRQRLEARIKELETKEREPERQHAGPSRPSYPIHNSSLYSLHGNDPTQIPILVNGQLQSPGALGLRSASPVSPGDVYGGYDLPWDVRPDYIAPSSMGPPSGSTAPNTVLSNSLSQRNVNTSSPYSAVRYQDAYASLEPSQSHSTRHLDNSGLLVVTAGGRSKYLGPGAASQWIREGASDNLRSSSPSPTGSPILGAVRDRNPYPTLFGYPMRSRPNTRAFLEARDSLPPLDEVHVLIDCYFRYVAWNSTPVTKSEIDSVLLSIFDPRLESQSPDSDASMVDFQGLSLIFSTIAFGCVMNMENPPHDPMAERYFIIAQQCLFNGRFLVYNTIIALHSLSIMAKFLSYTDSPGRHDLSWQLWGIATRMCQAMGLHRDGAQWHLSAAELKQRSYIFWETFNLDVWRSLSYNRPPAISPSHFDAKFPEDSELGPDGAPGWFTVKFRMVRLAYDILDESLKVVPSTFARITELWDQFCEFEAQIPYYLRCRAAYKAMVSRFSTYEMAEEHSPPASRADFRTTFRQHCLSENLIGAVFSLLRPYFVQALNHFPDDPTKSPYARAYLAVVERSSMMIAVTKSIYSLFPWASTRHWFFWADVFSAAVCQATVCIVSPKNPLVGLCLADLNDVINMYEAIRDAYPGGALRENLTVLHYLRRRYYERASQLEADPGSGGTKSETDLPVNEDTMGLVGWKTRLIELSDQRAEKSRHYSKDVNQNGNGDKAMTGDGNGNGNGFGIGHVNDTVNPITVAKVVHSDMPLGQSGRSSRASGDLPSDHLAGNSNDMVSAVLQQLLEAPLGAGAHQQASANDHFDWNEIFADGLYDAPQDRSSPVEHHVAAEEL